MAQPVPGPLKRPRFGEPLKFVPVGFVVFLISTEYIIYMWCHILPQLQLDHTVAHLHKGTFKKGVTQLVVFNLLSAMLVICYLRCVLTHPGEVPDTEEWEYVPPEARLPEAAPVNLQESKKSGDRRYCKWCGKFKPDRCHHCRICRTCILKMDHHCPWIYNCVGYFNYKYFFLLLFYTLCTLHFLVWTMLPTCIRLSMSEERFAVLFLVFFAETLGLFFAFLVTVFFCFHIWLISKALTTIEFCEKSVPNNQRDPKAKGGYDSSVYTLGIYANFRQVLGGNPLTVLLPLPANTGDGLSSVSEDTRLVKDMESTKGMRVKGHRITQRRYGSTSEEPVENTLPGPGLTPRNLESYVGP